MLAYPIVRITGSIVRNLTNAEEAALKLNHEFTDDCVDTLTLVDINAFDNSISEIMSASSLCYKLGWIAILI